MRNSSVLAGNFQERFSRGLKFEDFVKRTLWVNGFEAYKFGADLLPGPVKDVLIGLSDPTSSFMRYLPDLAVTVEGRGSFLVECKSGLPEAQNIAFERESWDACRALASLGVHVVVTAPGPGDGEIRAQWFDQLKPEREFSSPPKRDFNGCGKPFVTIEKTGLPALGRVLRELKNATHGL